MVEDHFLSLLKTFNLLRALTLPLVALRRVGPAGCDFIGILSYLHMKINLLSDTKM